MKDVTATVHIGGKKGDRDLPSK